MVTEHQSEQQGDEVVSTSSAASNAEFSAPGPREDGSSQTGESVQASDSSQAAGSSQTAGGSPASDSSQTAGSSQAADSSHSGGGSPRRSEAYAGPFTLRDMLVLASVLVMFIGSLIPFAAGRNYYDNLWTSTSLFFLGLGILLPLIVAVLFTARRLAPETQLRVGSLSVDQFGSVVAVFAAAFFFMVTAYLFGFAAVLSLLGALGLVAATTLAPHLPFFAGDFAERPEVPAHVVARDAVPPTRKRPKAPQPAHDPYAAYSQQPVAYQQTSPHGLQGYQGGHAGPGDAEAPAGPWADSGTAAYPVVGANPAVSGGPAQPGGTTGEAIPTGGGQERTPESFGATRQASGGTYAAEGSQEEAYEAFWFAVGQPRQILDENTGVAVFTIEPGAWVLALQDRGDEFLVQNTNGRVGVLRDLSNIERA